MALILSSIYMIYIAKFPWGKKFIMDGSQLRVISDLKLIPGRLLNNTAPCPSDTHLFSRPLINSNVCLCFSCN